MNISELQRLIRRGAVDTVLMVFPDMQGRWMGKRVTGRFFLESAAKHGTHACSYLLTVDMEMNTLPGFALTSWEKGYQDFHMVPDLSTIRLLPWLEKSAIVICDVEDEHGKPIEVAPRTMLRRQLERARAAGYRVKTASELEFYLFRETYESARTKGYAGLEHYGKYIEDYHMLQGTREEPVIGAIRNLMEAAGIPVEASKGEWGPGQHEINLEYAEALEMADRHTIYKHGAKEIAMARGASLTFMAKYDERLAGSSCHLHSSLWDASGRRALFWEGGKPSKLFRHWLAGQMALAREFSLFYAPNVNSYKRYQSGTFAPTRVAWARDNRTCGFRVVGEESAYRVENRVPGADANPYLAFAATIAAGLHGIKAKLEPPAEMRGNAYESKAASVPGSLRDAADAFAGSKAAREAFGAEVFEHYLHAARLEAAAFEKAVTDWERVRGFERG
ncbi:MAG TPA: glutamine synthetase family protein [Elusimicrobiota bacterium]|jgi:glutamine synthetase|nr:glutamine synthetase family protein [Elusimicrobiota bacterium]